jgi:hypothetical protein
VSAKETPWFKGKDKPVHVGVFKRRTTPRGRWIFFSKWDGRLWCVGDENPDVAAKITIYSIHQKLPWCGLAEKPQ